MGILKNRDKKEIFIIQNEADILMFAEVWIRLGEVLEDFFGFLLFWSAWFPPRQTYRLEWDSWQSCMVYHLHVARLHSTNIAYSPQHTLSPATKIHSIHVAILPHTFCIPSAVKERSWRANGSSHFGAPAYFLKRHSLPEFGLRGEMIISSKQNTSFYHHDQQKGLSRKIKSLRIWRCQNTIMPTAPDPIEVVILNSHDWQTVHVSTVSITEINLSTLFVVLSGHTVLEQLSHS